MLPYVVPVLTLMLIAALTVPIPFMKAHVKKALVDQSQDEAIAAVDQWAIDATNRRIAAVLVLQVGLGFDLYLSERSVAHLWLPVVLAIAAVALKPLVLRRHQLIAGRLVSHLESKAH